MQTCSVVNAAQVLTRCIERNILAVQSFIASVVPLTIYGWMAHRILIVASRVSYSDVPLNRLIVDKIVIVTRVDEKRAYSLLDTHVKAEGILTILMH